MHVFVSGRVSLDLAGTLKWRRSAHPEELLPDGVAVADWIVEAGLLTGRLEVDEHGVAAIRQLREIVYAATRAEPDRMIARAELQQYADVPPVRSVLLDHGIERQGELAAVLSTVARDAIELIGSTDIDRVHECGRPECTRLFVDGGRGKRRRWCGMAECGNRVKAAEYRRRRRAEQAGP